MFISHRYRVIFIHIQKAGGSSIQQLFQELDPGLVTNIAIDPAKNRPKHCFATDVEEAVGSELFGTYAKFCVVRNPFDRLVSWYWMLQMHSFEEENPDVIETEGDVVHFALRDSLRKYTRNFEDFVNLPVLHQSDLFDRFLVNQLDFISGDNGVIVDRVLRFEKLQEDFAGFAEQLGIPGQLPHMNKTPRDADYRKYYNATTKQAVAERFRRDLDYFGYSF